MEGDEPLVFPFIQIPGPIKKNLLRAIRLRKRHVAERRKTMRKGIWNLYMEKLTQLLVYTFAFDGGGHDAERETATVKC